MNPTLDRWLDAIKVAVVTGGAAWAMSAAGPDDVIIFWRPGCTVAVGLLGSLTKEERDAATWVNVVRDPAAAVVRSHRDGNMVTPTAVDGTGAQLSASADALRPLLHRD